MQKYQINNNFENGAEYFTGKVPIPYNNDANKNQNDTNIMNNNKRNNVSSSINSNTKIVTNDYINTNHDSRPFSIIHTNMTVDNMINKVGIIIQNKFPTEYDYMLEYLNTSINTGLVIILAVFFATWNRKWFYVILFSFIVFVIMGLIRILFINYVNNDIIRRPNPEKCMSGTNFTFFSNLFNAENLIPKDLHPAYYSVGMPSGHESIAAALITSLYLFFPRYKKVIFSSGLFYLILMGFGRIVQGCHNIIQVIAGLLLGIIIPIILHNTFHKK